ncbi:hypothetical protein DFH07DRAFT_696896, partial [Mycena maculata]
FIYACTVIKIVGDEYSRPSEQFEVLLGPAHASTGSPFADLDQLYTHILLDIPNPSNLLCVLGFVLLFSSFISGGKVSQHTVEILLDLRPGDARLTLHGMHSLMQVPMSNDEAVKILHASFADFVFDSHSGSFHIDPTEFYMAVAPTVPSPLSIP